jgi:riboflavin biosynthesis pyrimidine reductase
LEECALQVVSTAELEPGQVLAKAVVNAGGAVLCPAGHALTDATIRHLKNAGVESVALEGGAATGPSLEERLAQLEQRFETVQDPLLLTIKSAATRCLERDKDAAKTQ